MNDLKQEFHPVIEGFVCDFADDSLEGTEYRVFSELLYSDRALRQFALSARAGKHLLSRLRQKNVSKDFDDVLYQKISKLSEELHS